MRRLLEKKCAYLLNKYGQFFRVTFVGKTPKQCKFSWNTFIFFKRLYCVQTVRHHVNIRLADKKKFIHITLNRQRKAIDGKVMLDLLP